MTHHAANNPYGPVWTDALATLRTLIAEVHQLGEQLDSSRRNLHWRGGAEEYFQTEAARQHHYLRRNNDDLRQLAQWVQYAEQIASTAPASTAPGSAPKGGTSKGGTSKGSTHKGHTAGGKAA